MDVVYKTVIHPAIQAVYLGETGLEVIPTSVIAVLTDDRKPWSQWEDELGRTVRHATFRAFVEHKQPDGMGVKPAEGLLGLLEKCPDSKWRAESMRLVGEALKVGQGKRTDREPHADSASGSPSDGKTDYRLRRLHDQRPDLYQQVTGGETSVNAAYIAAGWAPKRISIRTDDPDRAVAALLRHYSRDQLLAALEDQSA
jgi:hypothetical protein